MLENIPVIAYDFLTRVKVGQYDSISKSARSLSISVSAIHAYLYGKSGKTFKGVSRGIKSRKSGVAYHFELKEKPVIVFK